MTTKRDELAEKYTIICDPDCEDHVAVIDAVTYADKQEQGKGLYYTDCFAVGMTEENARWLADALNKRDACAAEKDAEALGPDPDTCCCGDPMKNHANAMDCGHSAKSEATWALELAYAERDRYRQALERIAKGTHEEHPTCMTIPKKIGDFNFFEFGPPRTGGWEGWAREIDETHKRIATEALKGSKS